MLPPFSPRPSRGRYSRDVPRCANSLCRNSELRHGGGIGYVSDCGQLNLKRLPLSYVCVFPNTKNTPILYLYVYINIITYICKWHGTKASRRSRLVVVGLRTSAMPQGPKVLQNYWGKDSICSCICIWVSIWAVLLLLLLSLLLLLLLLWLLWLSLSIWPHMTS